MNLKRLARSVCVTASSVAGWREVRRHLVARFDGQDTSRLTLGALWAIQLAAIAAENTRDRGGPACRVQIAGAKAENLPTKVGANARGTP